MKRVFFVFISVMGITLLAGQARAGDPQDNLDGPIAGAEGAVGLMGGVVPGLLGRPDEQLRAWKQALAAEIHARDIAYGKVALPATLDEYNYGGQEYDRALAEYEAARKSLLNGVRKSSPEGEVLHATLKEIRNWRAEKLVLGLFLVGDAIRTGIGAVGPEESGDPRIVQHPAPGPGGNSGPETASELTQSGSPVN